MEKKEFETIEVNGRKYYSRQIDNIQYEGDYKIVVLQRGWALVGIFSQQDNNCKVNKAQVIRRWGTSRGLGELAKNGPLPDTILDPCNGLVEFDKLTMVLSISINEELWKSVL